MKNIINLITIGIFIIVLSFGGCTEESTTLVTSPTKPNEGLPTYLPKGTISGKLYDRCTNMAINGAKVSVGFDSSIATTTTDVSGSFSFAKVPAGSFKVVDGRAVATGTYLLTISLVDYNKLQTDPAKRYRDYYYFPVTITFTSLVPGDSLGVSGLVGAVVCSISALSATLKGTVVDQNLALVADARVTLRDNSTGNVLGQTRTATDGSYQFANIESGWTFIIEARSSDGTLDGSVTKTIPCNLPLDSLRTQVTAERIVLLPVDNVAPFITSITPEHNADVAVSGLQIIYRFSEPIKQTAYTRVDLGLGHGTIVDDIKVIFNSLKKTSTDLPLPVFSWNATYTQLTVTPSGIVGSAKYSVTLNANARANLKDIAGNALVNNTAIIGDFETLNFTTAGGTSVPAAPVLSRRTIPGIIGPLNFTGGTVGLEWNAVAGARSYNIYRSTGAGPFDLVSANVFNLQANVSSGSLVNPQGAQDPLGPLTVRFQVRAVNADLVEGPPSNIVEITDQVQPQLLNVTVVSGTGPGVLNWYYTLQFSEPLIISNAQIPGNYSIVNTDTVTFSIIKADYLGYNTGTTRYHVQLQVTTDLPAPAGYSIRAGNNIFDLAGNVINPTANTFTFSAPPVPILLSPASGATGVGLPVTLSWRSANGAQTYRLQVSSNAGFTAIVFDSNNLANPLTSTSYAVTSAYLTAGIQYWWRVSATNVVGTSAYSAVRTFTP